MTLLACRRAVVDILAPWALLKITQRCFGYFTSATNAQRNPLSICTRQFFDVGLRAALFYHLQDLAVLQSAECLRSWRLTQYGRNQKQVKLFVEAVLVFQLVFAELPHVWHTCVWRICENAEIISNHIVFVCQLIRSLACCGIYVNDCSSMPLDKLSSYVQYCLTCLNLSSLTVDGDQRVNDATSTLGMHAVRLLGIESQPFLTIHTYLRIQRCIRRLPFESIASTTMV